MNVYDLARLRKTTKIKLVFMSISIAIPIIIISILTPLSIKHFSDWVNIPVKVLDYVLVAIGEAYVIYKVVYYGRILGSENYAKQVLIKKNDERLIFIKQKYSQFTLKMLIFLLLIGIAVSGFLNTIVFVTLCGVLIALGLTWLITAIYYRNKY
ncbi:MAG: hypothetical protein K6G48_00920 [Acholeplasmatales bacterium]|nr:hypothetical protein [Acholeplasmatales bacterium]